MSTDPDPTWTRRYLLGHGEAVLGELVSDRYLCRFAPPPAFDAVRPLFEREHVLTGTPDPDDDDGYERHHAALELAREQIARLELAREDSRRARRSRPAISSQTLSARREDVVTV